MRGSLLSGFVATTVDVVVVDIAAIVASLSLSLSLSIHIHLRLRYNNFRFASSATNMTLCGQQANAWT